MGAEQVRAGHVGLGEGLVRRLVAGRFPQWAGLPVGRVASGGTVNAMFRLGDDLVVRLPLSEVGVDDVARERAWLPRLAPRVPVSVPEVVGSGEPAEGFPWPWSVYRWLPGEVPEAGALSDPVALAEGLAGFVAAMRKVELADAPPAYRGGPLASLDGSTRGAIHALRALPEEGVDCDGLLAVWEDALRAPEEGTEAVWLHADLMPGNLLVDEEGRLASVIDFGCTGVGDPACDLFPAWNLLPSGAREVFREALGVDDAAWRRGRGRTLSQAVIALPYYRTTNPAMAGNARHVIRAVLTDSHI